MHQKKNEKLDSISRPTLPEVVYRELRKAILNGIFLPGQMLRQDEVAASLGVSRSPLREALRRLEADGLLVLHPRRGYAIAELDREEVIEVFNLRILLEVELARRSIAGRTEADIANVYSIATRMRQLAEKHDDDALAQWFELHMRFHDALLMPAQCPHHLKALQHSRNMIEGYIRTEIRITGEVSQAQAEHAELAQAFVLGEQEKFLSLTRLHSEHTLKRLLTGLQQLGQSDKPMSANNPPRE